MSESFQNVAGWCKEDDERLIACAYHIRSADPSNIAKYISVVGDRLVLDINIMIQFDIIHAKYKKWKEVEAARSATGSSKKPSTYNVVHYWAVLWSDEEEMRTLEHEKRIIDIKREYDWALNNWSEFQRTSRSGKKSSRRYSPRPSPSEAYKSEFLENPARDSIIKELIEPLYRSAILCDNEDHQKVFQAGKRPFFIHQWDNPITIGIFPKKHHFISGDMQISRFGTLSATEAAELLNFVWLYIHERQPWEEAQVFTSNSVHEALLRNRELDTHEFLNIAESDNTAEVKKAMVRDAGMDILGRRMGPEEERKQRKELIGFLQLELKKHNERHKKPSLSTRFETVKGKLRGYENKEGVHHLSGVVQPSSHKKT
ncbi:MAG: hypothetical protein Q9186_005921 [Xanthomendoza sp. 1 TL-2023]